MAGNLPTVGPEPPRHALLASEDPCMKLQISDREIEVGVMTPGIFEKERDGETLKEVMVTFRVEGPAASSRQATLVVLARRCGLLADGTDWDLLETGGSTWGTSGEDWWFENLWLLRERNG